MRLVGTCFDRLLNVNTEQLFKNTAGTVRQEKTNVAAVQNYFCFAYYTVA